MPAPNTRRHSTLRARRPARRPCLANATIRAAPLSSLSVPTDSAASVPALHSKISHKEPLSCLSLPLTPSELLLVEAERTASDEDLSSGSMSEYFKEFDVLRSPNATYESVSWLSEMDTRRTGSPPESSFIETSSESSVCSTPPPSSSSSDELEKYGAANIDNSASWDGPSEKCEKWNAPGRAKSVESESSYIATRWPTASSSSVSSISDFHISAGNTPLPAARARRHFQYSAASVDSSPSDDEFEPIIPAATAPFSARLEHLNARLSSAISIIEEVCDELLRMNSEQH